MKRIIAILTIFIILFYCNLVVAQEKPLVIKGLYISMDIKDAYAIIKKLLPEKQWHVSDIGKTVEILPDNLSGDPYIFGNTRVRQITSYSCDYGFAIIDEHEYYHGFITADPENGKVIRISFSGIITDIFFSSSKINAEDFSASFWKYYNMPEFNWVPGGWAYTSPKGYIIIIKTDKFIDIKKENIAKPSPPNLKFE